MDVGEEGGCRDMGRILLQKTRQSAVHEDSRCTQTWWKGVKRRECTGLQGDPAREIEYVLTCARRSRFVHLRNESKKLWVMFAAFAYMRLRQGGNTVSLRILHQDREDDKNEFLQEHIRFLPGIYVS